MKNRPEDMGRARNMAHPMQHEDIRTDLNKRIRASKLLNTVWAHVVKSRPEEMGRG